MSGRRDLPGGPGWCGSRCARFGCQLRVGELRVGGFRGWEWCGLARSNGACSESRRACCAAAGWKDRRDLVGGIGLAWRSNRGCCEFRRAGMGGVAGDLVVLWAGLVGWVRWAGCGGLGAAGELVAQVRPNVGCAVSLGGPVVRAGGGRARPAGGSGGPGGRSPAGSPVPTDGAEGWRAGAGGLGWRGWFSGRWRSRCVGVGAQRFSGVIAAFGCAGGLAVGETGGVGTDGSSVAGGDRGSQAASTGGLGRAAAWVWAARRRSATSAGLSRRWTGGVWTTTMPAAVRWAARRRAAVYSAGVSSKA